MIGATEMTMTRQRRAPEEIAAERRAKEERRQQIAERRAERRTLDSEKAQTKYQRELAAVAARDAERQIQSDGVEWLHGLSTEGARRFAVLIQGRQEAVKKSAVAMPLVSSKALRTVRKAETSEFDRKRSTVKDAVHDVGTGQTILKLRQKAIARMIDQKKIGPEERDAATEIELAVFALSSRLMVQSPSNFDRIDFARSVNPQSSDAAVTAVTNYQRFAKVWSDRWAQYADPTLQIVVGAVIDELSIRALADEIGYRSARIEQALICGLRDYAARAGMTPNKRVAAEWQAQAEQFFGWRKKIPKDAEPMERAAINETRRLVIDDGQ